MTLRSWLPMPKLSQDSAAPTNSRSETISVLITWILFVLVWIAGLASTIYLVANALYLLFLAVVFGQYSPHTPIAEYLAFVARNSVPTWCFAAIGIAGLRFWPSERFRVLGLLAVAVETALAIYVFVKPESMLTFAG